MKWKTIGHFTVKLDLKLVISVRCKLLCDGGLCAACCRQTKVFFKARTKGETHKKNNKL